jgi:hypothetical protein
MDLRCTSCGEPFPLWTLPSSDDRRDLVMVCDPCRDMSALRAAREAFATDPQPSAWVQRALDGRLPVKVYA